MTRLVRAATSISAITLLSRVLGLFRDRLMAQTLGAGWVQGVFLLAWMMPNLMRRLLGEGALSAALIPQYARIQKEDPAKAKRLLEEVMGAVVTILGPICVVVAVASLLVPTEWFPVPEAGGPESIRLLLALNAVLFAYSLPICLAALAAGALCYQTAGAVDPGRVELHEFHILHRQTRTHHHAATVTGTGMGGGA